MNMEDRFWDALAAVETARGVRIAEDARGQLSEILTAAIERIKRGEATEEQFDAATEQLGRALMEAQLAMTSAGRAVLTALDLRSTLRGLCPLWPFC
jgi:tRNA(Ser,Leu) C12 N-acetylase TAN1